MIHLIFIDVFTTIIILLARKYLQQYFKHILLTNLQITFNIHGKTGK